MDVTALESAIAKQVLHIVERTFLHDNITFALLNHNVTISGQSRARAKGQGRCERVEAAIGDIVEIKTTVDGSHWNSASRSR